jgi:hypothetical protein
MQNSSRLKHVAVSLFANNKGSVLIYVQKVLLRIFRTLRAFDYQCIPVFLVCYLTYQNRLNMDLYHAISLYIATERITYELMSVQETSHRILSNDEEH